MEAVRVAADEARRTAQHERVKSTVDTEANSEIADRAAQPAAGETARIDGVAGQFRDKAVDDAIGGERTVARARGAARGSQFLDYAFYLVYGLLAIRLVLALIAACASNGFVQFIAAVTGPLCAPFRGIVSSPTAEGGYTLSISIVIAIAVYLLLHVALNGMLRMVAQRKTEI